MAAHHGPSLTTYFTVFLALMVLTAVTVGVAYVHIPAAAAVAVAIASLKATIVVLFFMHVRYETKMIRLSAVSGIVFLAILLIITMSEVLTRSPQPAIDPLQPQVTQAPPAAPSPVRH